MSPSTSARLQRVLFGTALSVAGGFAAWFAASLFAARYLVPPDGGLAGAATVAISGFSAALLAIVVAAVTAWRARLGTLTTATIVALVCGIGAASLLQALSSEREPADTSPSTAPGSATQLPVPE